MMGLREGWKRIGKRVAPHSERAVLSLAVISFYLLGMVTLMVVPLQLLTIVARRAATTDGAVIHLSQTGTWLLVLITGGTFAWSIIVGGFAKAFFTRNHLDRYWLFLFGVGLLAFLTAMFDQMRDAMSTFAAIHDGDNPTVTGFIAFWLLMVGYAGKAVWDEARDRIAERMRAFLPQAAPARTSAAET
jgi:hypothetical protein